MPPPPIALPDSPTSSPTHTLDRPWNPARRSQSSGGRGRAHLLHGTATMRDNLINSAERMQRRVFKTVEQMSWAQRILTATALVITAVLGILALVFGERIFLWLEPWAEKWYNTRGAWTILWAILFICAFPPMIGFTTATTTAGFVFGIVQGWLMVASATIIGSTCALVVSRTVLQKYVERMVANDKRFAALTLTIKHDGLKLLVLARLCPLPYSISNGVMSTIPTVHTGMYALATAIITPKFLIHVFIGSRLAAIAKTGEKMSAGTRAINWISIVGGISLGIFTGWYIYRQTMARAAQLEAEEVEGVHDTVHRPGVPPRRFSDDPEAQLAATTIARGEVEEGDNVAYFDGDDDDDDAEEARPGYRDDEEDVFAKGDGTDEEDMVGLHKPDSS